MPQDSKADGAHTSNGSSSVQSPAGLVVDLSDAATRAAVLERAFDFRGDVMLTLDDGTLLKGYLFDRRPPTGRDDGFVRLMPDTPVAQHASSLLDAQGNLRVPFGRIARIAFSERDPAAGKSFETWLKTYVEKKRAGQIASIFSEPLE
jgi:hypothetical protein